MTSNPLFGICLTLLVFLILSRLLSRFRHPAANPLFFSIVTIIVILTVLDIPYENYMVGGNYISFLIAPATIALVLNLYRRIDLLKKHWKAVVLGILAGAVTSLLSISLLSKLFGLERVMAVSLLPKSVTTAFAVPLAEQAQGLAPIALFAVVLTGTVGGIAIPSMLRALKWTHPVEMGITLGTASHAFGTGEALKIGEEEGAMSGLALAVAGLFGAVLFPLFVSLFFGAA